MSCNYDHNRPQRSPNGSIIYTQVKATNTATIISGVFVNYHETIPVSLLYYFKSLIVLLLKISRGGVKLTKIVHQINTLFTTF